MADIRITGRMVNFTRITFDTNDHKVIRQQLTDMMSETSYQGALVILDTTVEQELIALIQLLVSLDLQPMAVVDGLMGDEARSIQFPVLAADRPLQRIKATKEQVVESKVEDTTQQSASTTQQAPAKTAKHITSYHNEVFAYWSMLGSRPWRYHL